MIVSRDDGDDRVLACERCDFVICGYRANAKEHLLVTVDDLVDALPLANDPAQYLDGEDIVFRAYTCPGCQVLVSTEIVRRGEPALTEMQLE